MNQIGQSYVPKDLSVALQRETQSELTKACGRPGAREHRAREKKWLN